MSIKRIIKEYVETQETIQDDIMSLPIEVRDELKNKLEQIVDTDLDGRVDSLDYDDDNDGEPDEIEDDLQEISYGGIPELKASGIFNRITKWFKRFLTDRASEFLINASADEMKDTIQMIKVFDPEDMTGVFKPRAIYLGGGIDFADDAASWRTRVEQFFGDDHVVKGQRLVNLVTGGKLDFRGLDVPAILNPMRAETVRDEDEDFQLLFKKWKANKISPEEFKVFQEKIRELIVVQDLYMLKVCDTNLINFDGTAGAGTFGEAQISALKNSQVFIWLTNGMKVSNISPWMMPSVTKIIKEDELPIFLSNFK